jgi:hypothetical protein
LSEFGGRHKDTPEPPPIRRGTPACAIVPHFAQLFIDFASVKGIGRFSSQVKNAQNGTRTGS